MEQISFLNKLESIQCDLTSGIAALDLIQQAASNDAELCDCLETLHVVHTYLQKVRLDLMQTIEARYQERAALHS